MRYPFPGILCLDQILRVLAQSAALVADNLLVITGFSIKVFPVSKRVGVHILLAKIADAYKRILHFLRKCNGMKRYSQHHKPVNDN